MGVRVEFHVESDKIEIKLPCLYGVCIHMTVPRPWVGSTFEASKSKKLQREFSSDPRKCGP